MAYRVRNVRDLDEYRTAIGSIGHYFGWRPSEEEAERFSRMLPLDRMLAALDGTTIVGGAGALPFELTVPGGPIACGGVTVVGVLPTHRRRGLLRRMMEPQLRDIRERGEPVAALWASEETIYGRFGYGMAAHCHVVSAARRDELRLRSDLPGRVGEVRLVSQDEALRTFPRVYDRVRKRTNGFLSRSRDWWELRKLDDGPERRRGAGPLERALFELDGRPAGYALYRLAQDIVDSEFTRTIRVVEAVGDGDVATRELWRFLLDIDWVDKVESWLLPVDHPLQLLVARVSRLKPELSDSLWIRLVDVPAALAHRGLAGDGRVTFEVIADPVFPDNVGTWTVEPGKARRTTRRPDVRLDVEALGAAYLGGFSFTQLARAGRAEGVARGSLARADAAFRTDHAPWCPEIF